MKFNENILIIYHKTLMSDENLDNVDSNSIFGFMVDTRLATIIYTKTRDAYCDFVDDWHSQNDGKNIYDDFFCKRI